MSKKSLEKILITLFALFKLVHPNFSNAEQILYSQSQNPPPLYAQTSQENLGKNIRGKINDYKSIIANGGSLNDEIIERLFAFYRELSIAEIENALFFYNYVTKNHRNSPFLAEAHLGAAKILCHWRKPRDIQECKSRLNDAFETGTPEEKAEALYINGEMEWRYKQNIEGAKIYFEEAYQKFPNTKYGLNSKSILETRDFKKSK